MNVAAAGAANGVPNNWVQVSDGTSRADFIVHAQLEAEAERDPQSRLCCCEYYDQGNRRYHILGCCCNCEDFDLVFTDLITCRKPDPSRRRGMLLVFQDRLRIPWRGGAKQVSADTLLPILLIPLAIGVAAINLFCFLLVSALTIFGIHYSYRYVQRAGKRTRFFCIWLLWSIVLIAFLFEYTVPLLELLPEENLILVLLAASALYALHRTRQRAALNHVVQSTTAEDELPDIAEASTAEEEEAAAQTALLLEHDIESASPEAASYQPNICEVCHKYVPARTVHCSICGACIMLHDHHSYWLDCCIGEWNRRQYFLGLLLGLLACLLCADLTLTAICHPFLVARLPGVAVMLPDDCSEVFDLYDLGVAFTIAAYTLFISTYIFVVLMRQIYLISRGITLYEFKRGVRGNNKSCKHNWKNLIF